MKTLSDKTKIERFNHDISNYHFIAISNNWSPIQKQEIRLKLCKKYDLTKHKFFDMYIGHIKSILDKYKENGK